MDISRFECLVGEIIKDDEGMILGTCISVGTETNAYWNREYPVMILDNGKAVDLTYIKVKDD